MDHNVEPVRVGEYYSVVRRSCADPRVSHRFQIPEWSVVHQQLKRKGIPQQRLWEAYTQRYPSGCYSYSQFYDHYAHGCGPQSVPYASGTRW